MNTDIDIAHEDHSLGLTPVPAAIMTTLRWEGGGISLSCRNGPCSCTAGLSKFWKPEIDVPLGVVCYDWHETVAVDRSVHWLLSDSFRFGSSVTTRKYTPNNTAG